ncbi:MAG: 5-formyltetrahydrofolate cyclo-ligase [Desulfurococcales archaeon]|nr:5-formyltetrahydrofolate cyclo-ligase [Desulfurococcales archaeon]
MGSREKDRIRRMVWDELLSRGIARFPLPPHGRIPNFAGAEDAAARLFATPEWNAASTVKVNPDSPQRPVRRRALLDGKILVMPTPRLRRGFLLLDPSRIPKNRVGEASTIRGAFKYGRLLDTLEKLEALESIDLIVEGSVAVDLWGRRLGKGEGYGELEYAILREMGIIVGDVPIATTVHDIQVIERPLPQDPWDVPIDLIATPTRLIRVKERPPRPQGILWDLLPPSKLEEIPLLKALRRALGKR